MPHWHWCRRTSFYQPFDTTVSFIKWSTIVYHIEYFNSRKCLFRLVDSHVTALCLMPYNGFLGRRPGSYAELRRNTKTVQRLSLCLPLVTVVLFLVDHVTWSEMYISSYFPLNDGMNLTFKVRNTYKWLFFKQPSIFFYCHAKITVWSQMKRSDF